MEEISLLAFILQPGVCAKTEALFPKSTGTYVEVSLFQSQRTRPQDRTQADTTFPSADISLSSLMQEMYQKASQLLLLLKYIRAIRHANNGKITSLIFLIYLANDLTHCTAF